MRNVLHNSLLVCHHLQGERGDALRKVERENVKVLQDVGESQALCLGDSELEFLESLPLREQVQLAHLLGRDGLHNSRRFKAEADSVRKIMRCLPSAEALILREALCELGCTIRGGPGDCIKQSQ